MQMYSNTKLSDSDNILTENYLTEATHRHTVNEQQNKVLQIFWLHLV